MDQMTRFPMAPELMVSQWLNTDAPLSLSGLRGKVVVIEAFQMLCPGCVTHGLPQIQTICRTFNTEQLAVIGLHTVFEHHDAMEPVSLKAFLHEYQISFPVGVDSPSSSGDIPQTMAAYEMQGTPTLILIDRQGRKRRQYFGRISDMELGARIAELLAESEKTNKP